SWKPRGAMFTCLEMVRHVLEREYLFFQVIEHQGSPDGFQSPWDGRSYGDLKQELDFAQPFRMAFMHRLATFHDQDLNVVILETGSHNGTKTLGEHLDQMIHHETLHLGEMAGYLRTLNIRQQTD
ncbi:MAG: DinB family protein, partial [Bacteroidota bacterium]